MQTDRCNEIMDGKIRHFGPSGAHNAKVVLWSRVVTCWDSSLDCMFFLMVDQAALSHAVHTGYVVRCVTEQRALSGWRKKATPRVTKQDISSAKTLPH